MANGFTALYEQLGIDPKKRGTQFERIVKFFLENDPYYAHELVRVDLWKDSPHKWGTKDLGTDLIDPPRRVRRVRPLGRMDTWDRSHRGGIQTS